MLKKLLLAGACVCFIVLSVFLADKVVQSQTPVILTPQSVVVWDAVTTDIQGNPESIRDAEIGIFPANSDPNAVGVLPLTTIKGLSGDANAGKGLAVSGFLPATLKPGTYTFAVRVYDMAGNVSGWSNAMLAVYDQLPPLAPVNFKITIQIDVNLTPTPR